MSTIKMKGNELLPSINDLRMSPFIIFYEMTRACDLACRHCRANAQGERDRDELTTEQAKGLIDEFSSFPNKPMLVLTGGDPLKRDDVYEIISYGCASGLRVAMSPSATKLVTPDAISRMRNAGVSRMSISLDGVDAQTHDALRGVKGSYERTLEILADIREAALPIQINTTITQRNVEQVDAIADLLAKQGIVLWSVFFLIPVGRGRKEQTISADKCELVFERLWYQARRQSYGIKTTEAHHYRRFVLQQKGNPQTDHLRGPHHGVQRAPLGINDGNGVMFVSHIGQIYPSGFMPLQCGRFPHDSVVDVYQNSPVFVRLRDPDSFSGKCGVCEYRRVCGGSRARAYAVTGDPYASEPDCVYLPANWSG